MDVAWLSAPSLVDLIERNKTVTLYARCKLPFGEGSLVKDWYCGDVGIWPASPFSEVVLGLVVKKCLKRTREGR